MQAGINAAVPQLGVLSAFFKLEVGSLSSNPHGKQKKKKTGLYSLLLWMDLQSYLAENTDTGRTENWEQLEIGNSLICEMPIFFLLMTKTLSLASLILSMPVCCLRFVMGLCK